MDHTLLTEPPTRKRTINLTIREDLIRDVKELHINASKAAEAGIRNAVREAKQQQWRVDNCEAILAYNAEIATRGIAIAPLWAESDD